MNNNAAPKLKIVVVGHVDHGKSTLIGRIFYDTDALPLGKVEAIQKACEAEGMPFEYAFLLDALLEEQAQNITIDTTQIPFKTAKRGYTLIDAPGHKEFLKNMVTGAASADAAVLVVAASEGVREQSRRHGYLLRLLGIRQVVVAVNKMDLVGYDPAAFEQVKEEFTAFLGEIGLTAQRFVPVSAREGDNIARRADDKMPWYDGPTILETLDQFTPPPTLEAAPLRFPVQDVYRFDQRRILAGRVETGTLKVGDTLTFAPGNRVGVVKTIERWHGPARDFAVAGESIGITLTDQLFVERGQIAAVSPTPNSIPTPNSASRFRASLFWMGHADVKAGDRLTLKLSTQQVGCRIEQVERVLDPETFDAATADTVQSVVRRHDAAEVIIQADKPVAFDRQDTVPTLARFVLVQAGRVAGGGIVLVEVGRDEAVKPLMPPANIVRAETGVSAGERAKRNGHKGGVVWLTGLSGSGKSTVAATVNRALWEQGWQTALLDGDNLRHGLNAGLTFSPEDRAENIRRAAHVAALMAESGQVVLSSFISPYREDRKAARDIANAVGLDFIEVYVSAPVDVCETRDPKGLYQKARAGEIPNFTGVSAPYEAPEAADLTLDTSAQAVEESTAQLIDTLATRLRA